VTYNSRLAGPCADVLKELKKGEPENKILQTEISKLSEEQQAVLKTMGLKD
jgi:predicted ATPase